MTTPDTGTAAAAVTIHQSATESMRDLIGRQLEKARVGVFKIPDEAWDAYPVELNMRMAEWLSSEGVQPDPIDLSSYGRIKALCVDADPVALDKFLGAYTAFLMTEFMPVDAANRILLGVQWLHGSASAHQTDVLQVVARKVAEFRKIDAMIQPVQMIPAPVNGPARAKRLILDAKDHGDDWLMADSCDEMTEKLRALFWNDSFADLVAARIPMFLNRVLTGPDGKRLCVDDAEAVGLLLTDGYAVPTLRRLRGVRLDVLRALAMDCRNDDLVQLIDGDCLSKPTHAATPVQDVTIDQRKKVSDADVRSAWAASGGNKTKAAGLLGIHRSALTKRLQKIGLDLPEASTQTKPEIAKQQSWCPAH